MSGSRQKTPKRKMQMSLGDRIISFFTYIVYSIFAFVCVYPFYYIFINSIAPTISAKKARYCSADAGALHQLYQCTEDPGSVQCPESLSRKDSGRYSPDGSVLGFLGYMFTRETPGQEILVQVRSGHYVLQCRDYPVVHYHDEPQTENNFWGYIWPVVVQPFYVVLCKTFVESTPKELQEGGNRQRRYADHLLQGDAPVIKPILATIAIFAAVAQWNSFQDTLILMTDSKLFTLQFVLYQYINQANSLRGLINNASGTVDIAASLAKAQTATSIRMTVTIIVVTPIILVYPIFQRFFVKGIMIGAVKG